MAPSQPPSSDKTIRKIDIAQVSDFADGEHPLAPIYFHEILS